MKTFEEIYQLRENKDHLIMKLSRLTNQEKDKVIAFFKNHPNLENKIDWNDKNLKISDFELLMKQAEKSRGNVKKQTSKDLSVPFREFIKNKEAHLWYADDKVIFISPLSWKCAIFMDSFDCYGIGAKWCIGYEKPDYWNEYVCDRRETFIFVYNAIKKQKYMIQRKWEEFNLWDAEDQKLINEAYDLKEVIENLHLPDIPEETLLSIIENINDEIDGIFYDCEHEKDNLLEISKELTNKYSELVMKGDIDPVYLYRDLINEFFSRCPNCDEDDILGEAEYITDEILCDIIDYCNEKYINENQIDQDFMFKLHLAKFADVDGEYTKEQYKEAESKFKAAFSELNRQIEAKHGQKFLFENKSLYRLRY